MTEKETIAPNGIEKDVVVAQHVPSLNEKQLIRSIDRKVLLMLLLAYVAAFLNQ